MIENMTTELNREINKVCEYPDFHFMSLPRRNRHLFVNPVSTVIVYKKDHRCSLKLFPTPECVYEIEINENPESRGGVKEIARLTVKNILQIYE